VTPDPTPADPAVGVLGPLEVRDAPGADDASASGTIPGTTPGTAPGPLRPLAPRPRELLARLLVAGGRTVPLGVLVDDLWDVPDEGAVAAVRTFVAALRRALEPARPARTPPRLLVTEGRGYALRLPRGALDAAAAEDDLAAARGLPPGQAVLRLERALARWRGPAYADVADRSWARAEARRLDELRLTAVERLAAARLDDGDAAGAAAALGPHAEAVPWREEGHRLLALALYRDGRPADALAALRRARALLADELGVDPGPALVRLEQDVLRHTVPGGRGADDAPLERAASAFALSVGPSSGARLRAGAELLRSLAVTGAAGLVAAREQRLDAVRAAAATDDVELVARLVGEHDVPALWSRADDPAQARELVAVAEQTLARLPPDAPPVLRGRLLATLAVETRGEAGLLGARGRAAAEEAEALARELGDARLLVHALGAAALHALGDVGAAPRREALGAELVAVSARHGLTAHEVLGHLVRLQSCCALGDVAAADRAAAAADDLGRRSEAPLVAVFTRWYAAVRTSLTDEPAGVVEDAARAAATLLPSAGMPGVAEGLPALAVLAARVRHGLPWPDDAATAGAYAPWALPWHHLAHGRPEPAARAVAALPDPPPGHLLEALLALGGLAAAAVGDRPATARAAAVLRPARGLRTAGSGVLDVGPVDTVLARLDA